MGEDAAGALRAEEPRNFFRRVEVAFPVEDGAIADRIVREVLAVSLADNVKARLLQPDGIYRCVRPARGETVRRSQLEFIALAQNNEAKASKGRRRAAAKFPEVRLAPRPAALGDPRPGPIRKRPK